MQRLFFGLLFIGLVWAVGLAAFISTLPKPTADAPEAADGIVVYTGGGGARIIAGMSVFAKGGGKRLLISGVNKDISRDHLAELWSGEPGLFECCVDLGKEALTTEGNAVEAAGWAEKNAFKTVLLVTSEYHMPRAMTATKLKMPGAKITPYPVPSGFLDEKGRPKSQQAWRKLAGEYTKFILARVKALFSFLNV